MKSLSLYLYEISFNIETLMQITLLEEAMCLKLKTDIIKKGIQGLADWLPEVQYRILKSYCDYYENN